MKILITGSSGFIGSQLSLALLKRGDEIFGVDNHNDYYDPKIKEDRLSLLRMYSNFKFFLCDILEKEVMDGIFSKTQPDLVINFAAEVGVRNSLKNPADYLRTNVLGFGAILELCRTHSIKNLIYASSSSVYGESEETPYSVEQRTDRPMSIYAASKKSNELMAYAYGSLFGIKTFGLRFFTVYGPWGRPDMALFKFTQAMLKGEEIDVYDNGGQYRDFTFIGDVIKSVLLVIDETQLHLDDSLEPCKKEFAAVYNIGHSDPLKLNDAIKVLEVAIGQKAKKNIMPIQLGDVRNTYAEMGGFKKHFGYVPNTSFEDGVSMFLDWYRSYYGV